MNKWRYEEPTRVEHGSTPNWPYSFLHGHAFFLKYGRIEFRKQINVWPLNSTFSISASCNDARSPISRSRSRSSGISDSRWGDWTKDIEILKLINNQKQKSNLYAHWPVDQASSRFHWFSQCTIWFLNWDNLVNLQTHGFLDSARYLYTGIHNSHAMLLFNLKSSFDIVTIDWCLSE